MVMQENRGTLPAGFSLRVGCRTLQDTLHHQRLCMSIQQLDWLLPLSMLPFLETGDALALLFMPLATGRPQQRNTGGSKTTHGSPDVLDAILHLHLNNMILRILDDRAALVL